jgi:SAM-dependent methyltransferase
MWTRKSVSGLSPRHIAALIVLLIACCCRFAAPQEVPASQKLSTFGSERIVPFVPTPLEVVKRMLKLAKVERDDVVYDLGSGDGRIVIMAAQKFGAQAVGVELDDELFKKSSDRIAQLRLEKRARILHENMFETDLHHATVVTLYLLTSVNEQLRPRLEKQLRPGARVVSHDFLVQGWEPEKVEKVTSENGIEHTIYLYVRP